jgi:hypothetical protein
MDAVGRLMEPSNNTISRYQLQRSLVRAAMVRSAVTMLCAVPTMAIAGGLQPWIGEGPAVLIFFGGFLVCSWLMTKYHCKRAVTCPHCGGSLWDCGTDNFKPRRMKIRDGITECPNCHAPIV